MAESDFTTDQVKETLVKIEALAAMEKELIAEDHSGEIDSELDQLIAISELLRDMPTPDGKRDELFPGLANLIEGKAERIKKMLDSTYDQMIVNGEEKARREIGLNPDSPETLFRLSKERLSREKKHLEEMATRLRKLGQNPEIDLQNMVIFGNGFEAWGTLFWKYLEEREIRS